MIFNNSPKIKYNPDNNNPLYLIGNVDSDKKELAKKFVEFAKNDKYQKIAEDYGFNQNLDYNNDDSYDGKTLYSAQKIWKEEKNVILI